MSCDYCGKSGKETTQGSGHSGNQTLKAFSMGSGDQVLLRCKSCGAFVSPKDPSCKKCGDGDRAAAAEAFSLGGLSKLWEAVGPLNHGNGAGDTSPAELRHLAGREETSSPVRERLLLLSLRRSLGQGDMAGAVVSLTTLGDDAGMRSIEGEAAENRQLDAGRALTYYELALELARQIDDRKAEGYLLDAHYRLSSAQGRASIPVADKGVLPEKASLLEAYRVRPKDYESYYRVMALDTPEARDMLKRVGATREQAIVAVESARQQQTTLAHTKDGHIVEGVYTPERQRLHEQVLAELLRGKLSVPVGERPTIIFTGGYPGAGKSSMLKRPVYADRIGDYVRLDSDDLKERLGRADGIENLGWRAQSYHLEADDLLGRAVQAAVAGRKNIVFDGTIKNTEKMLALVQKFRALGYEVEVAFADLPLDKAMTRAIGRYLEGGRFVDPAYIASHDGRNRGTLEAMKSVTDRWNHWNTDVPFGEMARLVAQGGR